MSWYDKFLKLREAFGKADNESDQLTMAEFRAFPAEDVLLLCSGCAEEVVEEATALHRTLQSQGFKKIQFGVAQRGFEDLRWEMRDDDSESEKLSLVEFLLLPDEEVKQIMLLMALKKKAQCWVLRRDRENLLRNPLAQAEIKTSFRHDNLKPTFEGLKWMLSNFFATKELTLLDFLVLPDKTVEKLLQDAPNKKNMAMLLLYRANAKTILGSADYPSLIAAAVEDLTACELHYSACKDKFCCDLSGVKELSFFDFLVLPDEFVQRLLDGMLDVKMMAKLWLCKIYASTIFNSQEYKSATNASLLDINVVSQLFNESKALLALDGGLLLEDFLKWSDDKVRRSLSDAVDVKAVATLFFLRVHAEKTMNLIEVQPKAASPLSDCELQVLDSSLLEESIKTSLESRFRPGFGWEKIEHVLKKLETSPEKYFRVLTILQSTGFGKTKACFDLMRHREVVYFPCADDAAATNQPSVFAKTINLFRDACRKNEGNDFADKVICAIKKVAERYSTAEELRHAQLYESAAFCELLSNCIVQFLSTPRKRGVTFLDDPRSPSSSCPVVALFQPRRMKLVTDSNLLSWEEESKSSPRVGRRPLVIVFDEVSELLVHGEDPNAKNSPVRCLNRAINSSDVFAVYASTTSKLPHVVPGHHHSQKNENDNRIDHKPLYHIYITDQFAGEEENHPFFYGRPLWHTKWEKYSKTDPDSSYESLIAHVMKTLFVPKGTTLDLSLLVFGVRFALGVSQHCADDLLANHLATLIDIEDWPSLKYYDESTLAPSKRRWEEVKGSSNTSINESRNKAPKASGSPPRDSEPDSPDDKESTSGDQFDKEIVADNPYARAKLVVMYQSEAVLAEAAARFTSRTELICPTELFDQKLPSREKVLDSLSRDFKKDRTFFSGINKGDIGEFISTVACAFTMDALREDLHRSVIDDCKTEQREARRMDIHPKGLAMSQPVEAKDFVVAICPMAKNNEALMKFLEDYEVCFNHFLRLPVITANTPIEEIYYRCAAILVGGNNPRYDTAIILKKKSERVRNLPSYCQKKSQIDICVEEKFAILLIQVKNYSREIGNTERDGFVNLCLGEKLDEIFTNPEKVICMVLAVGGPSPRHQSIQPMVSSDRFPPQSTRSNAGKHRFRFASCVQDFAKLSHEEKGLMWNFASTHKYEDTPSDGFKRGGTTGLHFYFNDHIDAQNHLIDWEI